VEERDIGCDMARRTVAGDQHSTYKGEILKAHLITGERRVILAVILPTFDAGRGGIDFLRVSCEVRKLGAGLGD